MSGIFRKLAFSLLPVCLIGGAVELGLESTGWPQITEAFEHISPLWVTDPNLDGRAFSHKEVKRLFRVSSNSDGLRAVGQSRAKEEGVHRILAMGCSTTFGWGVKDADAYPAQLQARFLANGRSNVEVINGGQPGYTSFQGRWLWGESLQYYDADVVLIGFVVQDARKAAYTDKSQAFLQQDHRFLKDNVLYKSRTYLALRSILGGIQVVAKERPQNGVGGIFRVPPEDYVDNIRSLVASVQEQGGVPVLFGFPLERGGYTDDHRKILRAAATELEIPHFDPQRRMEKESRDSLLYFAKDRGHANVAGNDRIAGWVYDFLVEQELAGEVG